MSKKKRTILLVEDDPDQVTLALRAFEKQGIADEVEDIVVARDGAASGSRWRSGARYRRYR